MAVMSYSTAADVVHTYNASRCSREVARKLDVEREECFALVDWLWKRANAREKDIDIKPGKFALPKLTEDLWSEYLFANKVPILAAARSLNWTGDEMLARYRQLRHQRSGKTKAATRHELQDEADDSDREPGDPSAAEIAARASEVLKQREEAPQPARIRPKSRVEIQVWSDTRQ